MTDPQEALSQVLATAAASGQPATVADLHAISDSRSHRGIAFRKKVRDATVEVAELRSEGAHAAARGRAKELADDLGTEIPASTEPPAEPESTDPRDLAARVPR